MNMLRGILASLLLVLNTVAGCAPLYLMGAILSLIHISEPTRRH